MAATTSDERIATTLEDSARRSQKRAAHASAASAWLRAAELSTDDAGRTRRTAAAAAAAWAGGQPERARAALAHALPRADGEQLARLLYLSGIIQARTGNLREASDRLLEGAQATTNPSLKLELMMEAAGTAFFAGDLNRVLQLGDRAREPAPASSRDRLISSLLEGHAKMAVGDYQHARPALKHAVEHADDVVDPRALVWASRAASISGEIGSGLPYANRAVEIARREGLINQLPLALAQQSTELITNCSFDFAYAAAEEGHRLSLDIGHGYSEVLTNIAAAEAVWGRHNDARLHAKEALSFAARGGSPFHVNVARWTLGKIELSAGRPAEAAEYLLAVTTPDQADHYPIVGNWATPDAIEAAVRAGHTDNAAELLHAFSSSVTAVPTDGRRALLARSRALVDDHSADDSFREAINLAPALAPFERARTELLYGEWLRRNRRRQEARAHLRTAHEILAGIGAVPLAQRAEAELRATGETTGTRDPSKLDQLTPQELQIATLVTQGLTNRDIANQLFLSPRTVEYHLHKVFTKLGIASRTQLIRDGLAAHRGMTAAPQ